MKAEQRHQLHTNALADRMGRLAQGLWSKPNTRSMAGWVLGGLTVAVLVIWASVRYFGGWSVAWVSLDGQSDPKELETIAADYPGTLPARTARFQEARIKLRSGLAGTRNLYSADRDVAIKDVDRARSLYLALAPECKYDPILRQEALMGAARAEEALVGITETGVKPGDLGTAIRLYKELADKSPDTFLGQQAAERVRELETNEAKVEQFYVKLNELSPKKKTE